MNPFDALIEKKTVEQRREWMEPVKRNARDLSSPPRGKRETWRMAIVADSAREMESRKDRGNRLLLASLRKCMPRWDGKPEIPPLLDAKGARAISVDEWLRLLPEHESYQTYR